MLLLMMFRPFPPAINAVLHERKPAHAVLQAEFLGTDDDVDPAHARAERRKPPQPRALIPATTLNHSQPSTIRTQYRSSMLNAHQTPCSANDPDQHVPNFCTAHWHKGAILVSGALARSRNKLLLNGVGDRG
jgi:hypothetical protein